MSKRCVVSFADTPFYRSKMDRLGESLKGKTDADFIAFTDVNQIGCEPHSVIPYKFKPYAIKKAIEMGYESILWCDSPIIAVKDLSPVFEHIEKHGYLFFDNIGHTLGMWTNDKALNHFGISREKAMKIQMIMACCMGFRMTKHGLSKNTWDQNDYEMFVNSYIALADILYPGSWSDHRHDQSVASLLIHQNEMTILNGQQTFFMYENHRFAVPINEETICLISK